MIQTLLTPDAYHHDWYGWTLNESGHMVLGAMLAILIAMIVQQSKVGMFVAIMLTAAWEVFAYITQPTAELMDKITDAAFMAVGAALAYLVWRHSKPGLAIACLAVCGAIVIGIGGRI